MSLNNMEKIKQNWKIISASVLAGGTLFGGSLTVSNKLNCDYELILEEQTVCVSQEELDAVLIEMDNPTWNNPRAWDEI